MSRVFGVGLCSFGMSGQVFHGPLLQVHSGFELVGAFEHNNKRIQLSYPNARSYDTLTGLLGDPLIEVVVVNTPHHLHFEHTKAAILAGKHVIVEKPFALNLEEGEALIALSEKQGVVLTVFQNRRFDSDFLTLRQLLESHKLGEVVEAKLRFQRFRPQVDFATGWKEQPLPGEGLLYNLGTHMLDQAIQLWGMPTALDAIIDTVRAHGQTTDFVKLWLTYHKLPKVVSIELSYVAQDVEPKYVVHGTAGSWTKWGQDVQEGQLKAGMSPSHPDFGLEPASQWGQLTLGTEPMTLTEPATGGKNYSSFYDTVYQKLSAGNNSTDFVTPTSALQGIKLLTQAMSLR